MIAWIKQHQKALTLSAGIVLLVSALAMFFWSNDNDGMTQKEALAQANLERMEARAQGKSAQTASRNKAMQQFYESRQKQMRYLLIFMVVSGTVMVGYSLLKKEEP